MNLSQIRAALDSAGVRPAKKLGQNFLHDQNLARWIVQQAQISPDDFVLEIGPGLGALTSEILKRGARLLALEKDARLANFLREKFHDPRFELRYCDALDFDTRILFAERNVKVIGNLPYYIASQLLFHFVDFPNCISLALFMLQEEMARRLSAKPGNADYGALTVRLQLHHHVEYLRKIPRTVFIPQPEVASAIVRFTPRDEKRIGIFDYEVFGEIVKHGFSQRRKQLRKLLAGQIDNWESISKKISVPLTARAEELSFEQWIALTNLIAPRDEKIVSQASTGRFPVVDENDRQIGTASRLEVHAKKLSQSSSFRSKSWSDGWQISPRILRQDFSNAGVYSTPFRLSSRFVVAGAVSAAEIRGSAVGDGGSYSLARTTDRKSFQPNQFRQR